MNNPKVNSNGMGFLLTVYPDSRMRLTEIYISPTTGKRTDFFISSFTDARVARRAAVRQQSMAETMMELPKEILYIDEVYVDDLKK